LFLKKNSKWLKLALITVGVLVLLRMSAPFAIQHAGIYALNNIEGIEGTIGDVDLSLFRGAYVVEDVKIRKTIGQQQEPLISIARVDISILWSALLRGHIVTEISLYQPSIYILDTPEDQSKEYKAITDEQPWIELVDKAILFSIDRISLDQGKVTLRNFNDLIDQETFISDISGDITNITNSNDKNDNLFASALITAKLMDKSRITIEGTANPFSAKPTFDINAQMQKLSVKNIEGLIAFYTPFDMESGHIDGAIELLAKNGELSGYFKAGIHQLSVFSWRQDVVEDGDNPFQVLFEAAADLVGEVLENEDSKLIATRIPIQGTMDNTETSTLAAIGAVLQNAFLQTLDMEIENIVSFEQIAEDQKNKSSDNP